MGSLFFCCGGGGEVFDGRRCVRDGQGRGIGEGDAEEGCGWFGGCVFDGAFPKQPDFRVLGAVGSSYSAVHGAIGLKLPSVAILPWGVGRLLRKSAIKNNAAKPPTSLFRCFFSGVSLHVFKTFFIPLVICKLLSIFLTALLFKFRHCHCLRLHF